MAEIDKVLPWTNSITTISHRIHRATNLDKKGFFKTVDLGYYDDVKNAYALYKLNDMIACYGY